MTAMGKYGLLCVALVLVAGCTGAKISLEHHSEDIGQAPPTPQAGGSGPPELGRVFVVPTNDFTIPNRLPDLFALYHERLVAMAHVLPAEHAQQYADQEVAILKRRYAGDESALREVLIRRLQPRSAHPGSSKQIKQKGPVYPTDYEAEQGNPRRVQ
ncbi:MAG: hypothetical protein JSW10_10930 [Pseudomonadota bacterium]|nr:MAG: hypothetical protein JSW10_10930 [Pseudomonadota bacterium]